MEYRRRPTGLRTLLSVTSFLLLPLASGRAGAQSFNAAAQIAAGNDFTCALFENHDVKCWGDADEGKLGQVYQNARIGGDPETVPAKLKPLDFGRGNQALAIASGGSHLCAILQDHSLKCWGSNQSGQLGLGDTDSRGGGENQMGDNLPRVALGKNRTVLSVALGVSHSCALLDDHSVKCWGGNNRGQLGYAGDGRGAGSNTMGDSLPAVSLGTGRTAVAITAGQEFSCALLDNNQVKCWGVNDYGQLGHGRDYGSYPASDTDKMGDALPAVNLGTGGKKIRSIASAPYDTCAVFEDNTVKCWGANDLGQLGRFSGNTVGGTRIGVKADDMGEALLPADIFPEVGVESVSCGKSAERCCAISAFSHELKCWANNNSGALGIESTVSSIGAAAKEMGDNLPVVDLGPLAVVTQVAVGRSHTCALLRGGHIKCWGDNSSGQLGVGDTQSRGGAPGTMGKDLPEVIIQ